mmetsp:Transcript_161502/g.518571  ORF Transcript_161502/g.518571 Transcript_161502/m.518571 type:complete len:245 (+) Transcript_161502:435-1169(+)
MPLHDLRGWGAVGAAVGGDLAGLANHYDVQQAQARVEHPQQGLHTNNQHSESPSTFLLLNKGQAEQAVDTLEGHRGEKNEDDAQHELEKLKAAQQHTLRSCQPTVAQVEGPKLGRRQQSHVKYGLQQPPARHTGNGREDGGVHDIDEADKRGEEERHVEQTHGLPQAVLQLRDVEVDQGEAARVVEILPVDVHVWPRDACDGEGGQRAAHCVNTSGRLSEWAHLPRGGGSSGRSNKVGHRANLQ